MTSSRHARSTQREGFLEWNAAKRCLKLTDSHFEKATQHPTQTAPVTGDIGGLAQRKTPQASLADAAGLSLTSDLVAGAGLEPATRGL